MRIDPEELAQLRNELTALRLTLDNIVHEMDLTDWEQRESLRDMYSNVTDILVEQGFKLKGVTP